MPNLDIKETFLEKITSILSNHSENSVTLDLNSFENDDTLKYADLSLEMTLVDDTSR